QGLETSMRLEHGRARRRPHAPILASITGPGSPGRPGSPRPAPEPARDPRPATVAMSQRDGGNRPSATPRRLPPHHRPDTPGTPGAPAIQVTAGTTDTTFPPARRPCRPPRVPATAPHRGRRAAAPATTTMLLRHG